MIASSYETNDSFIKCDNNYTHKKSCLSDRTSLSNYRKTCLIKKSLSFKESIVSQSEDSLCELNDNATDKPLLEDNNKDGNLLNQLCNSLSCPGSLCLDSSSSQSRECGLSNRVDYGLHHDPRGVWPFCPVDVCTRCQDAALTLNNRGACMCDSVTPCHHQALFSSSNCLPCDDEDREPSMILQEGYTLLENQDERVKKKNKSKHGKVSVHISNDEACGNSDINYEDDDSSSTSSSSDSSSSSSSSSSSFFLFSCSSFSSSSSSSSSTSSSSSSTPSTTKLMPFVSEKPEAQQR